MNLAWASVRECHLSRSELPYRSLRPRSFRWPGSWTRV